MTYADSTERAALISGLRGLADYLESNPEVPAPGYSAVHTFPPDGDWAEMCAEIDAIAARLGVIAHLTGGGHYVAVRLIRPGRIPRGRHPAQERQRARASKANVPDSRSGRRGGHGRFGGRDPRGPDHRNPPG